MLPDHFKRLMTEILGSDYSSFVNALEMPPPVSIRTNPAKNYSATVQDKVAWTKNGFYLPARPVFTLDPLFHAGAYYVQEASSMFLEQVFKQHAPHERALCVLDLCAAPGGKSTHLISLMNFDSLLVSNEVIRSRVGSLTENIQKWGYPNGVVTSNDASDFDALPGFFDVVVVDAPCSGEGMFRKDPAARAEWSTENVSVCSARQKRILESIWPSIRKDGILIYSTCTFNKVENEENLAWLSKQHGVEFLKILTDPLWGIEETTEFGVLGYRMYPHRVKGEGFFMAVARKTEPQEEVTFRNTPKDSFPMPSKKISAEIETWISSEGQTIILRDDILQSIPARWQHTIHALTKRLRVVYAGTFLAVQKHNKLVPEHSLALSNILNKGNFFQLELTREEALTYLRKDNLSLDPPHKGFALAVTGGVPLGWLNILPGRMNNLYPQAWRIRMA